VPFTVGALRSQKVPLDDAAKVVAISWLEVQEAKMLVAMHAAGTPRKSGTPRGNNRNLL
jgi:fido (protein-threonine AMPylation protein)